MSIKNPIDTLIHARWILSSAQHNQVLENHSLAIHQGLILELLETNQADIKYHAKQVEHYPEHLVLPGFINAHTHLGMNYFRGLGSDLPLMDWLNYYMFPVEKQWLSHEFVFDASLFAMAELIRNGITCFNDMFYFPLATAEATEISGLRGFIGIHVLDFETNWAKTPEECFTKGLDFHAQYQDHPRIQVTFAPHGPYTVSDKSLCRVLEEADALQLKINFHLHETEDEIQQSLETFKKRPIKRLYDLGFLSPRVIAIHATNLNEEDLDILNATQPNIVHCPEANLKLASGICPINTLRAAGLNVALGTDSVASNNDLNFLSEMRTANFLSKITPTKSIGLNAFQTLALATHHGAKALNVEHIIGSLEPQKSADFIAINLDLLDTLPIYDPLVQLIYSANKHQIEDVWVAGKPLMKKHKLLTLDEEQIKEKARFWGEKIHRHLKKK